MMEMRQEAAKLQTMLWRPSALSIRARTENQSNNERKNEIIGADCSSGFNERQSIFGTAYQRYRQ